LLGSNFAIEVHMAEVDQMITTELECAQPKAKRRWFRLSWRKWLGCTLLLVVAAICLAVWSIGLPLSWTADYDRESYIRINGAIFADPKHLLDRRFDDVSREVKLDGVPWDDAAFQQPSGMFRIYHFRGFALYVTLKPLPAGITHHRVTPWNVTTEELNRDGVDLDHPGGMP
jgi:hypothetical protein